MSGRAVLSFSRDLEFATATELAKRMGCATHYWLRATIKELIDNSLDACEEAGISAPQIIVTVLGNKISVGDNGPGMSPELVERLCVVEEALAEHDVTKVIPDADALAEAWRAAKARAEIAEAVEKANRHAERWRSTKAPDGLLERVHGLLERHPAMSWDAAVRMIAEGAP